MRSELIDLCPGFAGDDRRDIRLRRTKHVCDGYLCESCGRQASDFANITECQLRKIMVFALMVSPLRSAVIVVRRAVSNEQVRRVDTRRIVATMANEHACWHGPDVQFPRQPVRVEALAIISDPSISLRADIPEPNPTAIHSHPVAAVKSLLYGILIGFMDWISMTNPSGVVHYAPTAGTGGTVASGDGTGSIALHRSLFSVPRPWTFPRCRGTFWFSNCSRRAS